MKRTSSYRLVDPANNLWQCSICGHMEQFEADGPFEAGWNVCPVCVTPVRGEEGKTDAAE